MRASDYLHTPVPVTDANAMIVVGSTTTLHLQRKHLQTSTAMLLGLVSLPGQDADIVPS
jgi:hypothetical protein